MKPEPQAFLSYTRLDDEFFGGAISALRRRLELAVQVVTGEEFKIFQDVDGIEFGQHWPSRLEETLARVRLLIPILTPRWFKSPACRDELAQFLAHEAALGARECVLPIYYVETAVLEDPALRARDPLACAIHERQRADWREHAGLDVASPLLLKPIGVLARRIGQALADVAPAPVPTPSLPAADGRHRALDRAWLPEMVDLPAGIFLMGSPDGEAGRDAAEGPRHEVRIARPFALGRTPVTRAQYDLFCDETGHPKPARQYPGHARSPAVHVSWGDAQLYVAWLRELTAEPWRLPSEAEWEYACRAGTTTPYWWGDAIAPAQANFGRHVGRPIEVGSYPPNPWGLHDMHGNVWEWVEDRWHPDYGDAPTDGSAWTRGNTTRRVVRGGSWDVAPALLRSASRFAITEMFTIGDLGFRVARSSSPETG
jgi:formylglycine-generating enzyme required for sulfatase activity